MDALIQWSPGTASDAAHRANVLFLSVLGVTAFVALCIFVVAAWFVVRYRAGATVDRSAPPDRNPWLEAVWISVPLVIFLVFGVWGARDYSRLYRAPADAVPVYIVAKQWMWRLQHANGRREIDELHLPVGKSVRLVMTSQDVIHSFYAPALRV